jgi:hypothetical protein
MKYSALHCGTNKELNLQEGDLGERKTRYFHSRLLNSCEHTTILTFYWHFTLLDTLLYRT